MEQLESQLPAADVVLGAALLDRIDEIVRPASTSTPPTAGGPTWPCSQPHDGARGTGAAAAGPLDVTFADADFDLNDQIAAAYRDQIAATAQASSAAS